MGKIYTIVCEETIDRETLLKIAKTLTMYHKGDVIKKDFKMILKSEHNLNPKIITIDKSIKEYSNLNELRKKVIIFGKSNLKGKSVIIKDTQTLTEFNEKGIKKTFSGKTIEEKLQSVSVLESILEEGIYYNTSYDKNDPNGIKYHNFLTFVKIYNNVENAFVRSVIKEYTKQKNINHKFYYHQFEYIENNKNEVIRSMSPNNGEQRTCESLRYGTNIPQIVKIVNFVNNKEKNQVKKD